jgi:ribosomal protein L17
MYRNMVTSLLVHGRIKTTDSKAKELRRIADRVITMGSKVPLSALEGLSGEELQAAQARRLHYIRRARRWVNNREALERLFGEYAERFSARPGGYTRILKVGHRAGDNAPMALIELVGDFDPSQAKDRSEAKATAAAELAAKPAAAVEAAPEAPADEPEAEVAVEAAAVEEPAAEEPAAEEPAAEEPAAEEPAAEEPAAEEPAAEEPAAEEPAAEEPAAEEPAAEEPAAKE